MEKSVSNEYKRIGNIYDPTSSKPFKISRSKIELFLECPSCFYIDRKLGIKRPEMLPYTLNNAVDELLKKEFDTYRKDQIPHPIFIENNINAIPFAHPDIEKWRDALHHGVQYTMPNTNIMITGGIDDVCINPQTQELIVVDFKATAKIGQVTLDKEWHGGFKRQIEVYQWLFRRNGFKVSNTAYFVYCNGKKHLETFDKKLHFDVSLIAYEGNDLWVKPTTINAYKCLQSNIIPPHSSICKYGQYVHAANEVLKK